MILKMHCIHHLICSHRTNDKHSIWIGFQKFYECGDKTTNQNWLIYILYYAKPAHTWTGTSGQCSILALAGLYLFKFFKNFSKMRNHIGIFFIGSGMPNCSRKCWHACTTVNRINLIVSKKYGGQEKKRENFKYLHFRSHRTRPNKNPSSLNGTNCLLVLCAIRSTGWPTTFNYGHRLIHDGKLCHAINHLGKESAQTHNTKWHWWFLIYINTHYDSNNLRRVHLNMLSKISVN